MKQHYPITIISIIFLSWSLIKCTNEESAVITPLVESWEKVIPHQEVPQGLMSLSAEHCGSCHQDHYNEWRLSTHAHAWTDQQFQAELKKESSPLLCINCHIPLQNQQEYIVSGFVNGDIYQPAKRTNPNFDHKLQQEGITCAACHVRNNTVIGPTGTHLAPHQTVKNPDFLSEELCISCHNATAVITPTLACSFETGDEWKAGPYYGKKNCIDCHMEATNRSVVSGYSPRKSRFHYFSGSGIPKSDTSQTTRLDGLTISMSELPALFKVNDTIKLNLTVKNEFAGHKVPTSDPERFFMISFQLNSQSGDTLSYISYKIGEEWEWYPEAKKISDNNLLPVESRTFPYHYPITQKEKLSLSVQVTKHRLSRHAANYNQLTSAYPLHITIFEKSIDIKVQ